MTAPLLEILAPLRTAIVASSYITSRLGSYNGAASVHTRRPVPGDAGYPLIVIGLVGRADDDGVGSWRPRITLDVIVYGEQNAHYRQVGEAAEALYQLFHRQRTAISVDNYSVVDLRCMGPVPAPVDDESRVGRRVGVTARLFATH